MIFHVDKEKIKKLKKVYVKGTRIILREMMTDPYHPIPKGTKGTVTFVDDIGTIHMSWDNGQSLGLLIDKDKFSIIDKPEKGCER